MIELQDEIKKEQNLTPPASIKVIGIGGAGGNTINSIIEAECVIESIAINTDAQALHLSKAHQKIQLGIKSTKGLGTGANPEMGKRAAEEDLDKVMELVSDTDIVFLTAGMGGGTGSGALPVIACALREKNILSIAIVTLPFLFEGKRRNSIAIEAITVLKKEVDTLIIIPNQKLLDVVDKHVSMLDAFAMINNILVQSVRGITDIITKPGHINVDFADVRTIMKGMGLAVMGNATASGENRAQEATLKAITSPLLENMRVKGAHGVLLNITGGKDLSLYEISEAASIIYEEAAEDAHIILGSVIDEHYENEVTVTIIATGFESDQQAEQEHHVMAMHYSPQETKIVHEETVHAAQPASCDDQYSNEKADVKSESSTVSTDISGYETDQKKEDTKESIEGVKRTSLDMQDLDIPTFMRKEREDSV